MEPKKIKKMLIDRDLTVAELARRTGYSRVWMSKVIHGRVQSLRAWKKILKTLDIKEKAA